MSVVVVLPVAYEPWGSACLYTMSPRLRRDTLLIDNSGDRNRGIMRSHNLGIDRLVEVDAEWLVVLSAAVRFGLAGGDDFVEALDTHEDHHVIEAMGVYGWHLIAFHRRTLDAAGRWDENFSPYGFDDLDYSTRIRLALGLAGDKALWDKVAVDATDEGMGHSLKLGGVRAPSWPRLNYYCAKWGVEIADDGAKSEPQFTRPFDDPTAALTWWPTPPDPRSILREPWWP